MWRKGNTHTLLFCNNCKWSITFKNCIYKKADMKIEVQCLIATNIKCKHLDGLPPTIKSEIISFLIQLHL